MKHVQFNQSESQSSKSNHRVYESDSDDESFISEQYYNQAIATSNQPESSSSVSSNQPAPQFIFRSPVVNPQIEASKLPVAAQSMLALSKSVKSISIPSEPQVMLSNETTSNPSTSNQDGSIRVKLVLDSGSSVHTCNDASILSNMHQVSTPLLIKDANGHLSQYTHKGTMQVRVTINSQEKLIHINDVYYAPKCPVNLLSVACLVKHGKHVTFFVDDAIITRKKDSHITMSFQRVNNIYVAYVKAVPQHELVLQQSNNEHLILPAIESKATSKLLQWHQRLGHTSSSGILKMMHSPYIADLKLEGDEASLKNLPSCLTICQACALGKSHRKEFHSTNVHTTAINILDRVHSDIFGPVESRSAQGHRYMLTIMDERSRKSYVWPLQHKSEAAQLIIDWCKRVHTETTKKLVEFHSDNGTEFVNSTLKDYFTDQGTLFTTTTVATPQHNGFAERLNRTLWESTRAMLAHGNLPKVLWKEAMLTANYIRNYRPTAVLKDVPPNSAWKKEVYLLRNVDPTVSMDPKQLECSVKHLRTFGCNVYVHVPEAQRKKLDNVSQRGIFIGYSNDKVGYYHILVLRTRKLIRSRDVTFHEDSFTFAHEYMNGTNKSYDALPESVVQHQDAHESVDEDSVSESESDSELDTDAPQSQLKESKKRTIRVRMRLGDQLIREADVPMDSVEQQSNQVGDSEAKSEEVALRQGNIFGIANSTDASLGAARFDGVRSSNIISGARSSRSQIRAAANGNVLVNYSQPIKSSDNISNLPSITNMPIDEIAPQTYKQAMKSHNRSFWMQAMNKEIQSLVMKQVFKVVDRPAGAHIMKSRWVFTLKPNPEAKSQAEKHIYKGRIVVKGFTQKEGVDYFETFAPVARYKSFRLLFALATNLNYEMKHLDVPTAFLNADLEEDAYMEQPPGYTDGDSSKVWKLLKSLYGTKQAPHNWNKELDQTLKSAKLTRCKADTCIYIKQSKNGNMMLVGVFVDDLLPLYAKCDEQEWNAIQAMLYEKYKIKEVSLDGFILGMRITRDRVNHILKIDQEAYIDKMLKQFGMEDCKPNQIPTLTYKVSMKDGSQSSIASNNIEMNHSELHDAIEGGELDISQTYHDLNLTPYDPHLTALYQQIVGSLNYASISTRPDITYAVHILSCHLRNPGPNHLTAAKAVLRYLKGTKEVGLIFNGKHSMLNSSNLFSVRMDAYSDSDWAGDVDDRHSTNGYVIQLNDSTISWRSKKQSRVALSSCEAEYYALCATMQEVMWFTQFLHELLAFDQRYQPLQSTPIHTQLHVDNQAAIQLSKYDVHHDRTKHIPLRYHFVREEIKNNQVQVVYISTENQLADIFTKGLGKILFNTFRGKIMSGDSTFKA